MPAVSGTGHGYSSIVPAGDLGLMLVSPHARLPIAYPPG
ncbi:hypothetical protein ASZ90_011342 [hydrocarbon metagenome]|uniref:Uncharacterized protein n=1 Tax=hydrocarbon metagenome TaxID=938273 RepID=A0A0W8FE82_9ZZZZ